MCRRESTRPSLVTTLVVLAICLVIVTGSTFSIFTSTTGSNIAITAGNVEMVATINTLALYSKGESSGTTFANGGTATLNDAKTLLTISNITPGDSVELTINLENKSNVDVAYRVTWAIEGELAKVLTATVDTKDFTAGTSEWTTWTTTDGNTKNITVIVEFPMGREDINYNDYQGESANITFAVEAVQANGTAEYDSTAYVNTAAGLQAAIDAGATEITLNESVELTDTLVIPAAPATYSLRSTPATVINLNGKTITAAASIADSDDCALIMNRGNLVITNGTINVENATAIRNHGATANLVLENMTVTQTGSDVPGEWLASAVFTSGGATTVIKNGTYTGVSSAVIVATSGGNLTINGGTFTAEKTAARVESWSYNSVLTINDGTFNSANKALYADGYKYVTVNGGTFNATIDSTYTNIDIKGGTFNVSIKQPGGHQNKYAISGGTFAHAPSNNLIAEGFKAVETANGWLVISENYNYVADGVLVSTDGNTYYISNAAGYAWVEAQADAFFSGKTVALTADIDFGGATIKSIRFWNPESKVVVDGQNHTLSNFVINEYNAGLFSGVLDVKNLIIDNANITGTYVGAISGNMYGNIDNCTVKNSTIASTYWQCGGLVGQYNSGNVNGCTVENCTISGGSAVGGLIGIINEATGVRKVENCTVNNCEIKMPFSFGGVYNEFFGAGVGLINISNSKVYFTDNTLTDNIVKGEASNALYGVDSGNIIFINGIQLVNKPIVVAPAPLEEDFLFPAGTNAVIYKDMVMTGDAKIVHSDNAVLGLSNVVATLDHDVIVRKSSGAIVIADCEFTLTDGAKLITVAEGGDGYQVFLINVKVNGVLLTQENAGQYLEGISYFNAVSEWPNA